jgi:hypothetical protein
MSNVRCSKCGKEHDLEHIEPSFRRPDVYLAVPTAERERRITESDDACMITSQGGKHLACFIRAVLYVPILGEGTTIGWGLWVEVNHETYWRIGSLWDDPNQNAEPPFLCTLANDIPNYPRTVGLPGLIQLSGLRLRPVLTLAVDSDHPFAVEARKGVHFERALEWRSWSVHR